MVTTKLNLSMTEPSVRQIYAKQGDTGRVLDITLDQTPEDGTLRILRPDGVEVTSEAVTGGEVESGSTFESLTEADVTELTVGIEPVQDLSHGDPSPSNICPITGHDEVRVYFGAEQGTADETYTTSLGQTVYGGTLDMVTGVLTVDKGYYKVTDVSQILGSGSQSGTYPKWVLALYGLPNVDPSYYGQFWDRQDAVISNMGIMVRESVSLNTDETTMSVYFHANNIEIRLRPLESDFPTLEEAKQAYVGAEFVYPVIPTTYQLTAQQIKTLVGTNNVWASSGDIVSITFTYGGLLSELPSEATEIVGKCYCDIEQNGVSSMPFTLNVKKNERES